MNFKRKLPIPKDIKAQYPLSQDLADIKAVRDAAIAQVFTGASDKMVLVVGPCSADREDAVLEYASRLAKLQEKVADRLILIPRVYTNKPEPLETDIRGCSISPIRRRSLTCWRV